jgi:hypothetical protein
MTKFDLEKALAGDKVVTRDGREVTQLVKIVISCEVFLAGAIHGDGHVSSWIGTGIEAQGGEDEDLFMAPKKLSGFVNVYDDGLVVLIQETSQECGTAYRDGRIACIDLSQFEEGHGL